ncbi:MAG: hypothetical protein P9L90_00940 [Candidatus Aadella gelida]|nr:hypothetical protein [Candidatus Aadella gelida]
MVKVRCIYGFLLIVFMATSLFGLAGCAQLRDKFIRKPEEEIKNKTYYAVREYDVEPSLELYTKRYIFWKTWHKELLDVLPKGNRKKIVVAVEQELSNLMDLQNMLVEEKALSMQEDIDQLMSIEMEIKKSGVTRGNKVHIRRQLESIGKKVKKNFSYRKMGGYVRDDFRDK